MIRPAVHPEGVAFVKGLGIAALALVCVALRFSSWPGELFVALIERIVKGFPPPSRILIAMPDNQALRKYNRREREHIRQASRTAQRKIYREQFRKRMLIFDCFAGILAVYLAIDWLFIPDSYKLSQDQRWPLALSIFLAGTIVIFIGTEVWEGRMGWKKWTFWLSLVAAFTGMLGITRFLPPRSPWGIVFNLIVGGLFFLWFFGRLRRIDQIQLEQNELTAGSAQGSSGVSESQP
jgi:hypothetical protein